jgi:hypothetical protein
MTEKGEKLSCECCGEDGPMYFHSLCHPKSPTWCVMHGDYTFVIECAECGKEIVRIEGGELVR